MDPIATFHRPARAFVLASIALSLASSAGAELSTDRPGQSEPPNVLAPGVWQIETGVQSSRDDVGAGERDTLELGGTLLRFGVSPRWELRVGWAGIIDVDEPGFAERGAGDARVGAKVALRAAQGKTPAVSLGLSTSVPVGDDAFTSDELDPMLLLSFAHSLDAGVGLTWNVGVARESAAGQSTEVGFYTAALARPLGERLGGFVELYGELPFESGRDDEHSVDAGLYYLLRPNLQLDLSAGLGLTDAALDRFVALGFVWRP